ncbi:hypothetical protein BDW74DRAFT_173934 [Aspergillus multicolor]|uniref:uncharacterized protein n=1 Tax=Aspergillus multicolor TaxID=41759 RepID=UPI003CCD5E1D
MSVFLVSIRSDLGDVAGFIAASCLLNTIFMPTNLEPVKVFITLPNGKAVTVRTTRGILVNCLLTDPRPAPGAVLLHRAFRTINWASLTIFAISLGMASLVVQLLLLSSMGLGTLLMINGIGCDESLVGGCLRITRTHPIPGSNTTDNDTRS